MNDVKIYHVALYVALVSLAERRLRGDVAEVDLNVFKASSHDAVEAVQRCAAGVKGLQLQRSSSAPTCPTLAQQPRTNEIKRHIEQHKSMENQNQYELTE